MYICTNEQNDYNLTQSVHLNVICVTVKEQLQNTWKNTNGTICFYSTFVIIFTEIDNNCDNCVKTPKKKEPLFVPLMSSVGVIFKPVSFLSMVYDICGGCFFSDTSFATNISKIFKWVPNFSESSKFLSYRPHLKYSVWVLPICTSIAFP